MVNHNNYTNLTDEHIDLAELFYIVCVNPELQTYKLCISPVELDRITCDPETMERDYWPISDKQLWSADRKAWVVNGFVRKESFKLDEIKSYFQLNPSRETRQTFGKNALGWVKTRERWETPNAYVGDVNRRLYYQNMTPQHITTIKLLGHTDHSYSMSIIANSNDIAHTQALIAALSAHQITEKTPGVMILPNLENFNQNRLEIKGSYSEMVDLLNPLFSAIGTLENSNSLVKIKDDIQKALSLANIPYLLKSQAKKDNNHLSRPNKEQEEADKYWDKSNKLNETDDTVQLTYKRKGELKPSQISTISLTKYTDNTDDMVDLSITVTPGEQSRSVYQTLANETLHLNKIREKKEDVIDAEAASLQFDGQNPFVVSFPNTTHEVSLETIQRKEHTVFVPLLKNNTNALTPDRIKEMFAPVLSTIKRLEGCIPQNIENDIEDLFKSWHRWEPSHPFEQTLCRYRREYPRHIQAISLISYPFPSDLYGITITAVHDSAHMNLTLPNLEHNQTVINALHVNNISRNTPAVVRYPSATDANEYVLSLKDTAPELLKLLPSIFSTIQAVEGDNSMLTRMKTDIENTLTERKLPSKRKRNTLWQKISDTWEDDRFTIGVKNRSYRNNQPDHIVAITLLKHENDLCSIVIKTATLTDNQILKDALQKLHINHITTSDDKLKITGFPSEINDMLEVVLSTIEAFEGQDSIPEDLRDEIKNSFSPQAPSASPR